MFKKRIITKTKLYFALFLCTFSVFLLPSTSIITQASEGDLELCTEYREWRWKIEDGKLYKRLYNASTGLWETDWIYVCDYPEGI